MFLKKSNRFWLTLALTMVLALVGCNSEQSANNTADSKSKSIGKQVDYKIVGIDPGTGIMERTKQAIEEYHLGEEWEVTIGSGAAMTASLKKAIDDKEPIIVTGWKPHWKFTKYDLKFLDDPNKVYGEGNDVHTLVRTDLKEDLPNVHKFLDQFTWELSEQQELMVKASEGMDPVDAAKEWVSNHPERVKDWTAGIEKGNGEEVTLLYAAWADVIATTNAAAEILTNLGYDVEKRQVEIGAMYAGIAGGSADAMLASWMPAQQAYYDEYKDRFEDLGPSSKGTRIGLVVPAYMDIDSIEDLKSE